MTHRTLRLFFLLMVAIALVACTQAADPTPTPAGQDQPQATDEPADTPEMEETATAAPTETAEPSPTIPPTNTAAPTATVEPTAEATATPEPAATSDDTGSTGGLSEVFESEEGGFSLLLPTGWVAGEAEETEYGTRLSIGPEDEAASGTVVIADASEWTAEELAAELQGDDGDAPEFEEVTLLNNITAQHVVLQEEGMEPAEWFFVEQEGNLIGLSFVNTTTFESLDAIVNTFTVGSIVETGVEGIAAAQAAREALARELAVDPLSIVISAVQAVDWRDSCLGIALPERACLTVITPGFAVALQTDDTVFQFHTDESGGAVEMVPGPAAPPGGLALTWEDDNGDCQQAVLTETELQFGPCDGEWQTIEIPAPIADQITAFAQQSMPFFAQVEQGTISVFGSGDQVIGPEELETLFTLIRSAVGTPSG
jgi:hypothetical protein